jgi:hypothetical protein
MSPTWRPAEGAVGASIGRERSRGTGVGRGYRGTWRGRRRRAERVVGAEGRRGRCLGGAAPWRRRGAAGIAPGRRGSLAAQRAGSRPAAAVQGAVGRGRERRRHGSSLWRRDERRGGREREERERGEGRPGGWGEARRLGDRRRLQGEEAPWRLRRGEETPGGWKQGAGS